MRSRYPLRKLGNSIFFSFFFVENSVTMAVKNSSTFVCAPRPPPAHRIAPQLDVVVAVAVAVVVVVVAVAAVVVAVVVADVVTRVETNHSQINR